MKLLFDAMGGDNAPKAIVDGVILGVREFGIDAVLVGREDDIRRVLREAGEENNPRIQVVHASECIEMDENPVESVRKKKDSSLAVCLRMLGAGEADGFVTASNTGAVLAGATLFVKRISGIRRAALSPILPTGKGGALLIDCGANVTCTPEYLLQFAFMGSFYAEKQMKIKNPRVGLINIGEEETKGTEVLCETHALLKKAGAEGRINFIGNIEGRDIAEGKADVLVCDGFTGNIVLKTYEGVGLFFAGTIKRLFKKNTVSKLAALAVKSGLNDFKKLLDYRETGGAPLLGISKPIMKAHGSSDALAIRGAIKQAIAYVNSRIIDDISANIRHMSLSGEKTGGAETAE